MRSVSAERFKAEEASGYDAVAEVFDRLSERFSGALAERILTLAEPAAGQGVLDIGTGAGLVALKAASRVGATGRVLGVDLSPGMLERARSKARDAGVEDQVAFEEMDAEALGLAAGSFDLVLSLFALPHFPDPARAVAEMYRVLRPGGRVVVAVGSGPPVGLSNIGEAARRLWGRAQRKRGRRLSAPAFLHGLMDRRLSELPAVREPHGHLGRRQAEALLRGAGFVVWKRCWEGSEAVIETVEDFWEIQRTFSSTARRRLAGVPSEQLSRLKEEFFERSRAVLSSGGRLTYPYGACFFVGARPREGALG